MHPHVSAARRASRATRLLAWCAGALCLAGSASVAAQAQDALFADSMEAADIVRTPAEASRFLQQATFGPSANDITNLVGNLSGLEGWIEQQASITPTLARPFLEQLAVTRRAAAADPRTINQDDRIHRWFDTAVNAPDQLRQRVAYALSQIIVVSDRADALGQEPVMMGEWNDLLVRNAFGNYRTLLREATLSPMMGRYLTSLRNRKFELEPRCLNAAGTGETDCNNDNATPYTIVRYVAQNNGAQPDENYAREVMQLFSIGLVDRELDFSPVLVNNAPVATYDQQMITTLSRALTGLSYTCTGDANVGGVTITRSCGTGCTGPDCRFANASGLFFTSPPRSPIPGTTTDSSVIHPDYYRPMVCYPRYHDNGRDMRRFELPGPDGSNPIANTTLSLGANTIPAGTPRDTKDLTLSGVLAAQLPEFMQNTSKELVADCNLTGASSLTNLTAAQRNQCIAQCDSDVDVAIDLLFNHPNTAPMVARTLIQRLTSSNPSPGYIERVAAKFVDNGAGVRGDLKAVVKAVLLDAEARLAPSSPQYARSGKPREPLLKLVALWRAFGAVSSDGRRWGIANPQNTFFQRPLGAPSVFNFFEPDYRQPGQIADAGLYSPEFQIINENSAMLGANELFVRLCQGYGNNNCGGAFTQPAAGDRAYIPASVLDALPQNDAALIEELNVRLMGGLMSGAITNPNSCTGNAGMKGTLYNLLRCGLVGTLGDATAQGATNARRRKVLYLVHLIAISPEYLHQR